MKEDFSDYGIQIAGRSPNSKGEVYTTCPQCSKFRKKKNDKCLSVNVREGIWYCNHCGWFGNLKDLGSPKSKRRKYGSTVTNVHMEEKNIVPGTLSDEVVKYFEGRGISRETLEKENIYSTEKYIPARKKKVSVVAFPYYFGKKIVNVKYRDGEKNFVQEKNPTRVPYRANNVIQCKKLYITEGEIDALTLSECGIDNVCSMPDGAPPPGSSNTGNKFDFLNYIEDTIDRAESIFILSDNDPPGEQAANELARRIGKERCFKFSYPAGCKDINDVLFQHGKDGVYDVLSSPIEFPVVGIYTGNDLREEILYLHRNGYEKPLDTGWANLNKLFMMRTKEFTVVTGVPGSGKSEFVSNLAANMYLLHDWGLAICSPESLPLARYYSMIIEKLEKLPFNKGPHERISEERVNYWIDRLEGKLDLLFLDDDNMTMDNMLELIKISIYRHGIKLAIIDPFNELDVKSHPEMSETQYIDQCLTKSRRFARLHDIHLIIVAHPKKLNRDSDGKYHIPDLYSISGSAAWRNKSDNGIVVSRNRNNKELENTVDIIVQKIRFRDVGHIGQCRMKFCYLTATYVPDERYVDENALVIGNKASEQKEQEKGLFDMTTKKQS